MWLDPLAFTLKDLFLFPPIIIYLCYIIILTSIPMSLHERDRTIPGSAASLQCCSNGWEINDIASIMLAHYVPNRIDATCILQWLG